MVFTLFYGMFSLRRIFAPRTCAPDGHCVPPDFELAQRQAGKKRSEDLKSAVQNDPYALKEAKRALATAREEARSAREEAEVMKDEVRTAGAIRCTRCWRPVAASCSTESCSNLVEDEGSSKRQRSAISESMGVRSAKGTFPSVSCVFKSLTSFY